MSSSLTPKQQVLHLFDSHTSSITPEIIESELILDSPYKKIFFLQELITTFGIQYKDHVSLRLSKENQDVLDLICGSFLEIQDNLQRGKTKFFKYDFPTTHTLIKQQITLGVSTEDFFESLRKSSYEIWPFPQQMLMHPQVDVTLLSQIERTREGAFYSLINTLTLSE